MKMTNQEVATRLDNLINSDDKELYSKQVEVYKSVGYRIFRNSEGKHKVEYNQYFFQQMFGEAFKGKI